MSCKKCNKDNCSCEGPIHVPPTFNCVKECKPKDKCVDLFPMQCVCYQGPDILELDIKSGDKLDEIIQKLILKDYNANCSNFEDSSACLSVLNLTVYNLTETSIALSWDPTSNANSYIVEYRKVGSTTWNLSPSIIAPTAIELYNLEKDTVYEFRVNAICTSSTCYSLTIRVKTKNNIICH